jgi:flagellar motor protein MotB
VSGEDKEPDPKQSEVDKSGAKPPEAGTTDSAKPESPLTALLREAAKALIPVLLTGASLIGFVAFAGAVIVWTRLFAIEVPPEQAVTAVPRAELVATGSSVLLLFGFFGVLAIVAAYLVDRSGRATPGMSRALLVLLAVEGAAAIHIFDEKATFAVGVFALIALLAVVATFDEYFARYVDELLSRQNETQGPLRGAGPLRTEANELRASPGELRALGGLLVAALALVGVLVFVSPPLLLEGVIAACLLVVVAVFLVGLWRVGGEKSLQREWSARRADEEEAQAQGESDRRKREDAERERLRDCAEAAEPTAAEQLKRKQEAACEELREKGRMARRRPHRLRMTTPGVVLLSALGALAIVLPCTIVGSWWLAVPLGSAMVLGIGVWRIAVLSKSNFMWYGLVVFISVPLFGTLTLMAHNVADPQVQPLALIRSTDGPDEAIQGIYITEGSERVYFANVATEGCSDKVAPNSGRLLWVPKSEVVAMSVGPLQDVEEAGKSALEMAYTLTPSVETPAAGAVSLTVDEKKSKKLEKAEEARELKEAETQAPSVDDQRLENPGPAVRPSFGTGLSLVPEIVSPGEEVELRLSVPNEDVNGFGTEPNGHTLRLNGVPLTPIREATPDADQAEYVKTEGGVLLRLDKRGVYGLGEEGRPYPLGRESPYRAARYVKLEDSKAEVVSGDPLRHPEYLRVQWSGDGTAELATKAMVAVENGEPEALESGLRRQAWHRDRIRFRVPDAASSGVVTVQCDQLTGSPFLRVSHPPTARIAVRMHENSTGITLDSRSSRDEDGEKISRRWTIEGLGRGHRKEIATSFPPRLGAYLVKLTVTDEAGNTDTAELRLLRLPTSLFELKGHPEHRAEVKAAAKALDEAVQARPPKAIELDGHTDHSGSPALNMELAFERDDRVGENLLREQKKPPAGELAIPVRELAYGRTCPVDPRIGSRPRNRRVDVFVLDEGVTVKPPRSCVPGRLRKTAWYPRLGDHRRHREDLPEGMGRDSEQLHRTQRNSGSKS